MLFMFYGFRGTVYSYLLVGGDGERSPSRVDIHVQTRSVAYGTGTIKAHYPGVAL